MTTRGIDETIDIVKFVTIIGVLLGQEFKGDGLQFSDILKVIDDASFRESLTQAMEGFQAIPEEMRDISISEGFDLSMAAISGFQRILEAWESPQAA